MQDSKGPSLSSLFGQGQGIVEELRDTTLETRSPEFQAKVKDAFRAFMTCQVAINRGEVFSANEDLEEFSADRLRFVLVAYYLADLSQQIVDDNREAHLLRSKQYIKQFLDDADRLGLLAEGDAKVWRRGGTPAKDANVRREEKMERGRREMQHKKKLRELRAKLAEAEKKGKEGDTEVDEDQFREIVMTEIQLAVKGALEALELIEQELPLLQMRKLEAAKGDRWKEKKPAGGEEKKEAQPIKVELPPGYEQHVGSRGEITISKRATLQEQVFRPGYNMATVSIEEAGERDYQEMLQRQAREAEHAKKKAEEPDEDNTVHYDNFKIYEERDWDAFKDDNPTGCGNTTGNLG